MGLPVMVACGYPAVGEKFLIAQKKLLKGAN